MNLLRYSFSLFIIGSFIFHSAPLMAVKTWNQILNSESWDDAIAIATTKRNSCRIKAKSENATDLDRHNYTLWKLRLKAIRKQASIYTESLKQGRQLLLSEINERTDVEEAWENYLDAKHIQQIDALREQARQRRQIAKNN